MKLIQRSLKLILILQEFHFPLELPNSNLEKNNLQRGGSFSHSFQLWLKVSLQKNQLKECKPCKMLFCSFVPFQTGVKPRKKQTHKHHLRRANRKKKQLVILNLRVGSRSFLKGMNKVFVQTVCVLQLLHLMEASCGHVIRCALKPSCPLCRAQSPPQKLLPLLHYAAPV